MNFAGSYLHRFDCLDVDFDDVDNEKSDWNYLVHKRA